MSDKTFVTGHSEVAQRIADALGLKDFCVGSLELMIDPHHPITLKALIYPTKEQVEALGGEIEKFTEFGVVRGAAEFTYTEENAEQLPTRTGEYLDSIVESTNCGREADYNEDHQGAYIVKTLNKAFGEPK
jgi:single-stranded DNA-specific DHH superfamily exonuclease